MNENAIVEVAPQSGQIDIVRPLPIEAIIARRTQVLDIMNRVMKKDVHYGVVKGCGDKPTLLKPGAEAICSTFQVAPEYEIKMSPMDGGHREITVICKLYTIQDHRFVGSGVGMATTMESKHRWRYEKESTGQPLPKKYWDNRDSALIGGDDFAPLKVNGKWFIARKLKVENTDPADQYNTVLKMAKKRSNNDATIGTFGASDMFTQDLEDIQANQEPVISEPVNPPQKTASQSTDDLVVEIDNSAKQMEQKALDQNFSHAMAPHYATCNESLVSLGVSPFNATMHYTNALQKYVRETSPAKRITDKAVLMATTEPKDDEEFNYVKLLNMFIDYRVKLTQEEEMRQQEIPEEVLP